MLKCAACGKFLASNEATPCSVCPSLYHKECVGVPETALMSGEWACPGCKKKVRKGDSTPVKGSGSQDAEVATSRRAAARAAALAPPPPGVGVGPGFEVQGLRHELAECMVEMREFRKEIAEFRVSVAGISARMDGIEDRLEAVEQRHAGPAAVEVAELERTVMQLKLELNDREQEALMSDIEIGHLPEEKGENVLHAVTVLAAKLGVALEERDVVFAERLGVTQGAGAGAEAPRERRVVVRLARHHLRDQLLQAARVRRSLTATDAGSAAPQRRIFVNER
ncbi:Zinc finger DNA binding protein, partial [Operophtera brumata]